MIRFLSTLAIVALTLGHAAAAERVALRFGVIDNSVRNVPSLPLTIAQRNGYFAREGIDLNVVVLRGV